MSKKILTLPFSPKGGTKTSKLPSAFQPSHWLLEICILDTDCDNFWADLIPLSKSEVTNLFVK
jgi:hypothetical protein